LIAGFLDATDYVDAYALASPWMHFMNFAFSTGSATIGTPNDAALGAAFGIMITNQVYMIAGLTDTNGDPTKPFDGFKTFVNDHEYFKSVEIGLTTSADRIIFDNVHLTFWHKDEQVELKTKKGWGLAGSASRYINDNFMPFLRGGYSEDGGTLLQKSVSVGIGYQTQAVPGLFGAAINWGQPNEDTFGPNLKNQHALEIFYRITVLNKIAITADTQLIMDPALNPDQSTIWMFNLRARIVV